MERVNEGFYNKSYHQFNYFITRGVAYTLCILTGYSILIGFKTMFYRNTPKRVHLLQVINLH